MYFQPDKIMGCHALLLVILLCYVHLFVGIVQSARSLSKEADIDMEIHKKLLNKPSIKTIQDKYGGVYDCVNVYEQAAFDHPSLKNHTIDFQVISTMIHHKTSETVSLRSETCPVGTIPNRRISKADLIRESEITNRPNTYLAIARTKDGPSKYSGATGLIRTDNPKVVGQQFSAARIKLQAGADSIEAGWRADPSLYGDSRTRLFIRTDAGNTHCFNIRCPGFVQTNHGFNFDAPLKNISISGGQIYVEPFYIVKDKGSGNWNLVLGVESLLIGYWPSRIFTRLAGLADRVEWGGAAYSPPGMPLPPMGSGNHPIISDEWDGFVAKMKVLNEKGQTFDATDIEIYEDNSKLYSVHDLGIYSKVSGRMIFYGGPGHQ